MATVTTTLIVMGTIAGVIVACLLLAFRAFTAHGRVIGSEARLLQGLPGSAEDASASSGSVVALWPWPTRPGVGCGPVFRT